tara:strand:+ start:897 stop:1592 length:696 start_codon:yes stop_codon:yes gene_type:complete
VYYLKKALKRWIKGNLGLRTYPGRYDQLLEEIDVLRPKTILEVGTNDGINAVRLFKRASKYRDDVVYFGFDMFESLTDATFLKEFALTVPSQKNVDKFLQRNGCSRRHLFAGNTIETLNTKKSQLPKMDLVFLDGGHSQETVASDWINVQDLLHEGSVVFFDDYPNWGIGPVVDTIDCEKWDVQILPIEDIFSVNPRFVTETKSGKMSFKFARVQARSAVSFEKPAAILPN